MVSRLPSSKDLGPLPDARSGRSTATYDPSSLSKIGTAWKEGLGDLGRGVTHFGSSLADVERHEKALNDELEAARFRSGFAVDALKTSQGLRSPVSPDDMSDDEDDETAAPAGGGAQPQATATPAMSVPLGATIAAPITSGNSRVDSQVEALISKRDELLKGVTDPHKRELLRLSTEDNIQQARNLAANRSNAIWQGKQITYLGESDKSVISQAVEEDDPQVRADLLLKQTEQHQLYRDKGILTEAGYRAWRKNFVNTYGEALTDAWGRKGKIGDAIKGLEEAISDAAKEPPPKRPDGKRSDLGYTSDQIASIKGGANAAKPGREWGDPREAGFSENNLATVTLKSGKTVTVNKYAAPAFEGFLNELEDSGYQIRDIGGYNYRNIRNSNTLSQHAFGNAIDVNPDRNPFQRNLKTDLPENISDIAAKYGISWGGDWKSKKDAMHFEFSGVKPSGTDVAEEKPGQPYKVASADGMTPPPGNAGKPIINNPDGSFSTERTITIESDGRHFVVPTIVNGKQLSEGDAIKAWRSGENKAVGEFDTREDADRYAKERSGQIGLTRSAEAAAARPKTVFDAMDPLAREKLLQKARQYQDREITKSQSIANEGYERQIIDASAGRGDLPDRSAIERAPDISEIQRNTLLRQYDGAAKGVVAMQNALKRYKAGEAFNPFEKEDRDGADKIFLALGGDDAALTSVAQRTRVMPDSAAKAMRADFISTDPKRVIAGATRASNLLANNPNIFAKVEGGDDIEKTAIKYRTWVDDYGMTAQEAASKLIREQTPEYKSAVNARIKSEDIDDKIKKNLSVNDLASSFDPSFLGLARNPTVGNSVRQRDSMFDEFAERVKEHYLDTASGDLGLAKKLAANDLKKTWGVSEVNGSKTLMKYPPEKAPAYQALQDPLNPGTSPIAAMISTQAVGAIKAETGQDVEAKSIRLSPVLGVTAQQYKSGQPPSYTITWEDKNGLIQQLRPGRVFVADLNEMRSEQQRIREEAFRAKQEEQRLSQERMQNDPAYKAGQAIKGFIGTEHHRTRDEVLRSRNNPPSWPQGESLRLPD